MNTIQFNLTSEDDFGDAKEILVTVNEDFEVRIPSLAEISFPVIIEVEGDEHLLESANTEDDAIAIITEYAQECL